MRVVHVVTQTGTYGGERFVPALARAQRNLGIDARIITIYDSPPAPDLPQASCGRHGLAATGGGFAFLFRLLVALRSAKPDIVHTHLAHGKFWGRLAAVAAGAGCIVHTEHSNEFSASLARRIATRVLHRRTAVVVALTHAHAERIAQYEAVPKSRIVVVPNGVDATEPASGRVDECRRALGLAAPSRIVLVLGRLDAVKQPLRALAAWAALAPRFRSELCFAGDGPLRGEINAIAEQQGLANRVHLLGYREDVPMLLRAADVVLNSSDSEAMPLSLVEALCAGVPVVSTPWPGAAELLGPESLSADFSPTALSSALERVLDRGDARPERERGEARDRFSMARTAKAYKGLYEQLCASRRNPVPKSAR
jgi:glycosyltransferase involved in cell wall biosynthesis